jgi:putative ABC transport system permease protein
MSLPPSLRSAWREWRAHPGLSILALVTLALGIGGSTTMFGVMAGIGTGMPPVADGDRVARIFASNPQVGTVRGSFTLEEYDLLRGSLASFDAVAAFTSQRVTLDEHGSSRSVDASQVSADYFRVLGFTLAAGRTIRVDECASGANGVVIVSERFATERWPSATAALGRVVTLDGEPHTVIGVLPDRSWFPAKSAEVWTPLDLKPAAASPAVPGAATSGDARISVIARLRPSSAWPSARAELQAVGSRLVARDPSEREGWSVVAIPLSEDAMKRAGYGLFILLGPAVVVLLVACTNVAHLTLARALRRQKEMAVRAALGANRLRLVRDRLAEGAWLAGAAGLFGLVVAYWGMTAARLWINAFKPGLADSVRLNPGALAFALGLTGLTPLVFGLFPAISASRANVVSVLHDSARRAAGRRGPYGTRDLLVIVEMALAVGLVVTAGMFGAFVWEMNHIERGFDASKVFVVRVDGATKASVSQPAGGRDGAGARVGVDPDDLLARVRAVPGVRAAGWADAPVPFELDRRRMTVAFDACDATSSTPPRVAPVGAVGDGYFRALGLTILRGRAIDASDSVGGPPVVVVSEALARRCWSGNPIGRRVRLGNASAPWSTVVGVATDALTSGPLSAIVQMAPAYQSVAQSTGVAATSLVVRTDGDRAAVARGVQRVVRESRAARGVPDISLLDDALAKPFVEGWLMIGLMDAFAALALVLAAIGVFGVTAYSVAERTREFGIRMALGARPSDVLRSVIGRALAVVALATVAAVGVVFAVTRVMWAELITLGAHSPLGFVAIAALLGTVSIVACVWPARRATRVDPVTALRAE